jgi:hypothetical protein
MRTGDRGICAFAATPVPLLCGKDTTYSHTEYAMLLSYSFVEEINLASAAHCTFRSQHVQVAGGCLFFF